MSMNIGLLRRFCEPLYFTDYSTTELSSVMDHLIKGQGFVCEDLDWEDFFALLPLRYIALFNGALCKRTLVKLKDALTERVSFSNVMRDDLFKITLQDYHKAKVAMMADASYAVGTDQEKADKSTKAPDGVRELHCKRIGYS